MSFTTLAVTGTVLLEDDTPAEGATVELILSSRITDGVTEILPRASVGICNDSGDFTISGVNANDDSTTTPTGTTYAVTVNYAGSVLDSWNVVIPHASAPTVDLFSLTRVA
jgi:hypothetical protein